MIALNADSNAALHGQLHGAAASGRQVNAEIRFAHGGGRTFIARQYVPYPFHVTKPHRLDRDLPDLATLCLQSASGGLYRDDRLQLTIRSGPRTAARVVSQAATIVHTALENISVRTDLTVEAGSFFGFFADPYVLFAETSLDVSSEIVIDPSAFSIIAEGFDRHDPEAGDRPFARLGSRTRVRAPCGRLLVDDEFELVGEDLGGGTGPLGPNRAFGSVMILGNVPECGFAALRACLGASAIFAGVSELPNQAGVQVRLLAADGGRLVRGMQAVVTDAFRRKFGVAPARMRR